MLGWKNQTRKIYNFLVAGPWNHGGWAHGPGKSLGDIRFTTKLVFIPEKIESAVVCVLAPRQRKLAGEGSDALSDRQRYMDLVRFMPPRAAQTKNLYFHEDENFPFEAPKTASADAADSYVSDPAHPVPYRTAGGCNVSEDHPGKLVHMVGAGSKVRGQPAGRADVEDGGAERRCDRRGKRRGEIVRVDGREAMRTGL